MNERPSWMRCRLTGRCLVLWVLVMVQLGAVLEALPFQTDRASRVRVACMAVDLRPENVVDESLLYGTLRSCDWVVLGLV